MARDLSGQQHFQLVDIKRLTKIAQRKLSGQRAAQAFNDFISLRLVRHMIGQAAASPQEAPPAPNLSSCPLRWTSLANGRAARP